MVAPRPTRCAVALVFASLLGCTALPPEDKIASGSSVDAGAVPQSLSAGANEMGEPCRYEPAAGGQGGEMANSFNLFCGTWQQPSGRVYQAATAVPPGGLDQAARASAWRAKLDERIACAEPEAATLLGSGAARLMKCKRRSGGWPHIALVGDVGGATFFLDGVPSALPALETVVAELSGEAPPARNRGATAALAGAIAAHPFGSGDLDSFYTLMRLGTTANDAGEYAAAEQAFRSALAIQERILGANDPGLARPMMDLALQISNEGRYVEADKIFARVRALAAASDEELVRARLALYLAEHDANRSRLESAKANNALAEQGFADLVPRSLLDAAAGRGGGGASTIGDAVLLSPEGQAAVSGLAASWSLKSLIAYQNANYAEAKNETQRVDALLRASGVSPPGVVPRALRLAALSDAGQGNLAAAVDRLGVAADLFGKDVANDRPQALTLFLAGRTALAGGKLDLALGLFRQGAKIGRERHLGFPPSVIGEYMVALDKAAHAPGADAQKLAGELFEATQLIQEGVTSQVVAQAFARLSAGDAKARDLLREMQDADLRLAQLYAQRDQAAQAPSGQDADGALAKVDAAIAEVQEKRAAADSAAQAASPEYARLVSTYAPVDAVQRLLAPHEGLLTLIIGAKASFGVLVEANEVREYPIALDVERAGEAVAALRKTIEPDLTAPSPKLPEFDLARAHRLYETLLAPVEGRLRGLDRLVVVESGPLTALPLEVLVTRETPPVADGNYKDVPFLVTQLAISYEPAPQTLVVLRRSTKPSAGPEPYVGFGDFRPATPRQLALSFPPDACGADYSALAALPTLPGTRREIEVVGSTIFHAPARDIVLGADFTKSRLLASDLTRFRIVHLATHAILPSELRCRTEPLIVLSASPGAPNAGDAFLGLSDVLALKLDANLVLLSACNTAGPAGGGAGDSLSGLARAFFFAGARGLLVTHWSLDDTAGPLLTALSLTPAGAAPDSAEDLRQAKLAMIRKAGSRPGAGNAFFTHPFAWAPFVLVGDGMRSAAPATSEAAAPAAPRRGS
jgi:CHAT domain-containing protein